ncbi:MAG: lipocalin family protein [Solidesulfovibrio sp. DCME]|uniref:lipocalin family protein n=1 Tax=Solidesulfovibrio sp. DCME TaxID=3447380 RepID=UPI003D09F550
MFKFIVLTGICLCIAILTVAFVKLPIKYIIRDLFAKEMPLETVQNVDLNRYQGTWFSAYEFYAWFQAGCKCTKAEYLLTDSGKVEVKNSCYRDGNLVTATAIAWPINKGDNSKLYVQFRAPFKGKYYILSIDEDYQHVLVGTPDRNYLWILSRTKTIDENTFKEFKAKAEELGFDSSRFLKVNHECSRSD